MKLKNFIICTSMVVGSIAIGLTIFELILPFVNDGKIEEAVYQARRPVVQAMFGEYNPILHYTLKANLENKRLYYPGSLDYIVSSNNEGFRGELWDYSPDRKNIFIVGDSFAFGWGVEWKQTVGELIEKKLQENNKRWQVINLAMPGYSIQEIMTTITHFKKDLHPVAIVYIFCPNDLESIDRALSSDNGSYDLSYHGSDEKKQGFTKMVERNQTDYWYWDKFRRQTYLHAFYARYVRPIISERIKNSLQVDNAPDGFDFHSSLTKEPRYVHNKETQFLTYCLNKLSSESDGNVFITTTSDKSILVRYDNKKNLRWVIADASSHMNNLYWTDFEKQVRNTPDGKKYFLNFDDHWSVEGHKLAAEMLLGLMDGKLEN